MRQRNVSGDTLTVSGLHLTVPDGGELDHDLPITGFAPVREDGTAGTWEEPTAAIEQSAAVADGPGLGAASEQAGDQPGEGQKPAADRGPKRKETAR